MEFLGPTGTARPGAWCHDHQPPGAHKRCLLNAGKVEAGRSLSSGADGQEGELECVLSCGLVVLNSRSTTEVANLMFTCGFPASLEKSV